MLWNPCDQAIPSEGTRYEPSEEGGGERMNGKAYMQPAGYTRVVEIFLFIFFTAFFSFPYFHQKKKIMKAKMQACPSQQAS